MRDGVSLRIKPIEGELTLREITDRYAVDLNEGEPTEFYVTRATQYHITYEVPKSEKHRFVVDFIVQ